MKKLLPITGILVLALLITFAVLALVNGIVFTILSFAGVDVSEPSFVALIPLLIAQIALGSFLYSHGLEKVRRVLSFGPALALVGTATVINALTQTLSEEVLVLAGVPLLLLIFVIVATDRIAGEQAEPASNTLGPIPEGEEGREVVPEPEAEAEQSDASPETE